MPDITSAMGRYWHWQRACRGGSDTVTRVLSWQQVAAGGWVAAGVHCHLQQGCSLKPASTAAIAVLAQAAIAAPLEHRHHLPAASRCGTAKAHVGESGSSNRDGLQESHSCCRTTISLVPCMHSNAPPPHASLGKSIVCAQMLCCVVLLWDVLFSAVSPAAA